MAEMIRDSDSSEKHISAARRHGRLLRRIKDGGQYWSRIEPAYKRLQEALTRRKDAETAQEDARDDLFLADFQLDNRVKTVFEQAAQNDREQPENRIQPLLFAEGKFTAITQATAGTDEPDLVDRLVARMETLPEGHPLRSLVTGLRDGASASRQAYTQIQATSRTVGQARSDEELEQEALRRQYEANYLDLRKTYGKEFAESLFPRLSTKKSREAEPSERETSA